MNNIPEESKKQNILIVDDTPANLRLLSDMLKGQGYKVRPAPNGKLALKAAITQPPDLILLDINMPELDGFEVCERLKQDENLKGIPVIFISALTETLNKVKAFGLGAVDYITKPFQFNEVHARVTTHLRIRQLQTELEKHNRNLQQLVQEQVKEISDSQMTTIYALTKLAESRDDETGKHIERVQWYCKTLAEIISKQPRFRDRLDEEYINTIFKASPLHDIGKVGIPDNILLKPGGLTPEEFRVMKTHTIIGAQTLEVVQEMYPKNRFINVGVSIARSHHEQWDGAGYPHSLKEEDIPFSARIMAVADVYDALRSKRVYKEAFSHQQSCDAIISGSGTHFDPDIITAFKKVEKEFAHIHHEA